MSDKSKIGWTDATWNIVTGCSVISPGCTNCYAMRLAGTRLKHHPSRKGLTEPSKSGPVWNGQVRFNEQWIGQPAQWKKPRHIFVAAHGDLFHEHVHDEWLCKIFEVMWGHPEHTFQILTKRPERMLKFMKWLESTPVVLAGDGEFKLIEPWPLRNVWLGVSVEDQKHADERIPILLATLAARRFVSIEPQLDHIYFGAKMPRLDCIIQGCESGPGRRDFNIYWARSIRDQCEAANIPYFLKQIPVNGSVITEPMLDDVQHLASPW